jgi:4-hydroxybenzoate polyprenyltransferase
MRRRWTAYDVARLLRSSALGGTLVLPVAGAATGRAPLSPGQLVGLLAVGTCFHVYAYVLNDVVDLPIDRTEPRRAYFPLITGLISPRAALVLALTPLPVAVALTLALAPAGSPTAWLAAAVLGMAVYDLWGKRCPLPPATDVVQGLAWGALVGYGAAVVGRVGPATLLVCGFVVVLIVLANGVHGSLRDLANDRACGVRSTALLFGAAPAPGGGLVVPPALVVYAVALELLLLALVAGVLGYDLLMLTATETLVTGTAVAALSAASLLLLLLAVRSLRSPEGVRYAGYLHLAVTLALPLVLVAARLDPPALALLVAVYAVPLALHRWTPSALQWLGSRTAVTGRPAERAADAAR